MTVTVYTLPDCVQCDMTKKQLDRYGIEYEVKSFEEDPDKAREFVEQGFKSAPVVVTDYKTWSGFRHEELRHLAMTQGKSLI
jgi:glutaredoxin-like protein NrdH